VVVPGTRERFALECPQQREQRVAADLLEDDHRAAERRRRLDQPPPVLEVRSAARSAEVSAELLTVVRVDRQLAVLLIEGDLVADGRVVDGRAQLWL
jgi:hypothetical protein